MKHLNTALLAVIAGALVWPQAAPPIGRWMEERAAQWERDNVEAVIAKECSVEARQARYLELVKDITARNARYPKAFPQLIPGTAELEKDCAARVRKEVG